MVGNEGGSAAKGCDLSLASEHLPSLRFRPVGSRLAVESSTRRGNKRMSWARFMRRCDGYFPQPRTLHPYPYQRFDVTHPRWEPYARKAPVRFCAGLRLESS